MLHFRSFRFLAFIIVMGLLLSACGGETTDPPDSAPLPETPPPDLEQPDINLPAPDELTADDARTVLRYVYRPIHAFYQRTVEGQDLSLVHPDSLRPYLTQTMSPDLAKAFIDQLLMQQGDGAWIVRPTEMILNPHMEAPALKDLQVERIDSTTYALTERYAETELYGNAERTNVVRYTDGRWLLAEVR